MILLDQSVKLLKPSDEDGGIAMLKAIEYAGRNCYASQDRITDNSYIKFVENLIKRGHETPLEFADLTFDITTSRAVLAEMTRHRLSSFCVESQRYIQEAKTGDIAFIKPEWFTVTGEGGSDVDLIGSKEWILAMENAETVYKRLIGLGMKPEEAREVLPNSTACRIIMKANVREFRHIFSLRCAKAAYPQMRSLARSMLSLAQSAVPVAFDDLIKTFERETD